MSGAERSEAKRFLSGAERNVVKRGEANMLFERSESERSEPSESRERVFPVAIKRVECFDEDSV